MTILDAPMGALARTLVGTFGRAATINRKGASDYDTATGRTLSDTSSISCSVVIEAFAAGLIDGTIVQQGDVKGIVSGLEVGYKPVAARDTLTEGGRTWQIVNVIGYSSGASEAAYSLHLRR